MEKLRAIRDEQSLMNLRRKERRRANVEKKNLHSRYSKLCEEIKEPHSGKNGTW